MAGSVTVDRTRCTQCGRCISEMEDYCISEEDGYPVFDRAICNTCQKCAAICPAQAIMINSTYPEKIGGDADCKPEQLVDLFSHRRSTKRFLDTKIPREKLEKILAVARYAPNQNKNISIIALDSQDLISEVNRCALGFVRRIYGVMFAFKPMTLLIRLFYRDLAVIRRKMECDLFKAKRIVKENTQGLIILTGNKHVPVTKSSAQYLLASMIYMAEAMKIGSCLMDSLLLSLNHTRALRRKLGIRDDVLGVLSLGYSAEPVVNIPRGYEIALSWNPNTSS